MREFSPHVVVVDLHMPVMDGEEVCRVLEKNFPEVKIIVLTMEDDEEYVDRLIGWCARINAEQTFASRIVPYLT